MTEMVMVAFMAAAVQPEDGVTPAPLPAGPVWARLLLENPWPLILICAAAGLIAFFILMRRGKLGRGAMVAGGLAVFAAMLWGLARWVETEREEVKATAAELVDAAAKADTARLDRLLDESATAYTVMSPGGLGKSGILAEVRRTLGEDYPVKEYDIRESQAVIDGPGVARAQLRVYVLEGTLEVPFTSWWGLDLRRDEGGDWRITAIRPMHPWIAARPGR